MCHIDFSGYCLKLILLMELCREEIFSMWKNLTTYIYYFIIFRSFRNPFPLIIFFNSPHISRIFVVSIFAYYFCLSALYFGKRYNVFNIFYSQLLWCFNIIWWLICYFSNDLKWNIFFSIYCICLWTLFLVFLICLALHMSVIIIIISSISIFRGASFFSLFFVCLFNISFWNIYRFTERCKDNTQGFCVTFSQFPLMILSYKIIEQYKKKEFDIGIIYVYNFMQFYNM